MNGRSVLVTRPGDSGAELAQRLSEAGADAWHVPAIAIKILDGAEARGALADADRLLITSRHGLEGLLGPDNPTKLVPVWAVGKATANLCEARGFPVAAVVSAGGLPALVPAILAAEDVDGLRVLWPRGDLAAEEAVLPLIEAGATLRHVTVYETLDACSDVLPDDETLAALDAVLFASPSAVRFFTCAVPDALLPALQRKAVAAAIGPTTNAALLETGWRRTVIAAEPSNDGLASALMAVLR